MRSEQPCSAEIGGCEECLPPWELCTREVSVARVGVWGVEGVGDVEVVGDVEDGGQGWIRVD